jgi:hypothetical protein
MKMLESYNQKLEVIKSIHDAKFRELKKPINGLSYQQTSIL